FRSTASARTPLHSLSLHDALPISQLLVLGELGGELCHDPAGLQSRGLRHVVGVREVVRGGERGPVGQPGCGGDDDRFAVGGPGGDPHHAARHPVQLRTHRLPIRIRVRGDHVGSSSFAWPTARSESTSSLYQGCARTVFEAPASDSSASSPWSFGLSTTMKASSPSWTYCRFSRASRSRCSGSSSRSRSSRSWATSSFVA